jgi:hypothetical protein
MRIRPTFSYPHFMLDEPPGPQQRRRHPRGQISPQRLQARSNITAAALFVIGCLGFYSPRLHFAATTAFLVGSVLFLVSAVIAAQTTSA